MLNTLLSVAGYASILLVALSVLAMVRTIGKPRPLVLSGLLIQMAFSGLFLALYSFLLNLGEPTMLSWGLMGAGLGAGIFQGFTTRITVSGDRVTAKRSILYLLIWGLTFTATQLLALLGQNELAAYGLSSIYLATGIALGMNGTLVVRRLLVAPGKNQADTGKTCPDCGEVNSPGRRFCRSCGRQLPESARFEAAVCAGCGQPVTKGQRFCNNCGKQAA